MNRTAKDIQIPLLKKFYISDTPGDAVNDVRYSLSSSQIFFEVCTVANATKGSGTWIELLFEGSMYFSGANSTLAIGASSILYVVQGLYAAGTQKNVTFTAGKKDAGASLVTTADAGVSINIGDAANAHGLSAGDIVCVQSANHNGVAAITIIDLNNFKVPIMYLGDESCTWQRADYLKISVAGDYLINYSVTFRAAVADKVYRFTLYKGLNVINSITEQQTITANLNTVTFGTSIESIITSDPATDKIFLVVSNETDTEDIKLDYSTITVCRL